jgi:hypothetical protein
MKPDISIGNDDTRPPRVEAWPFANRSTHFWVIAAILAVVVPPSIDLSTFLLYRQDRWLLLAGAVILLLSGMRLGRRAMPLALPRYSIWALASLVVLFCYAGHVWVLDSYDLSRDEQMAVFDARIFSSGLLAQPLPAAWQPHVGALNTRFMLSIEHPIAWVSAYLPMNAVLRSVVGFFVDPAFTGPLMTGAAAIALWHCTRLLWPEDREAAIVALLLFLASGQVLIAGMTAYAMPAHLALNLLWLWLFLLRRRTADIAALVVGFVATGLHQPLFHPLFVGPFLFCLLRERAWSRLVIYVGGYAAIVLFWIAWPVWTLPLIAGPHSTSAKMGADYWTRLRLVLLFQHFSRFIDMSANLLRFMAWQPILLVPLMAAGAPAIGRDRFAGALAVSFLLPILVMFVILPHQGNGFGYRYLHGTIGSAILLAIYGWRRLMVREKLRPLLLRTFFAGIIIILPMQLVLAHKLYATFATANKRIAMSGADYFILGSDDSLLADDLVLNRPDLSNRPIRLLAARVDDPFIRLICRPGVRIVLGSDAFLAPIDGYYRLAPRGLADQRIPPLSARLTAAGCQVDVLRSG